MAHRTLPHSLRGDQRGASIVELALFMPFMVMLIVGIIDLSNGIAMQFGLNKAVNRTLELATANSVVTTKNASEVDYSYLARETARAAEVPEENVTLTKWVECDGTRQATFETMCDPGESIARYVQIEATKPFSPTFSLGPVGETVDLRADAAVRVQ